MKESPVATQMMDLDTEAPSAGVLVKSAVVMEQLGQITRVAFDKTGTLTEGAPRLAVIAVLPGSGLGEKELLALAAAAENPSEHPLARAVVTAAREAGMALRHVESFVSTPGHGVWAWVDGRLVEIGRPVHPSAGADPADAAAVVAEVEEAGQSAVVVRLDGVPVGVLGIAGHRVLLVGDGVNDAPALAAAHTGVAMGRAGSDLALGAADAVIVRDELATIAAVVALSRRARRVVTANLVIAATFIAVLSVWDLLGHLPLPLGVLGHEGSTVIVGLNGLRLLRAAAWRRALAAGGAR
jgi:cation transport ATPase